MNTRYLKFLTPLALGILMGCPPAENNDDSGDMNAMSDMGIQKDMPTDKEDMRIEKDMPDVKEDMPRDMPDEDMPIDADMPPTERTQSALTSKPASISYRKTGKLALLSGVVRNRASGSWNRMNFMGVDQDIEAGSDDLVLDCEPDAELFACTLTVNVQLPAEGDTPHVGIHTLTLTGDDSETLEIPVHFHMPWGEVKAVSPQHTSFALPNNFARCGLDANAQMLTTGPGIVSVMTNDANDAVSLRLTADGLAAPTPLSVDIDSADIMASDFEVARTPDGGISAAWFAYDDNNGQLCGVTDHFKATGITEGTGTSFCTPTHAPLKRIVDVQWGLRTEGDTSQITARIMAITAEDRWVSLRMFDGSDKITLESEELTSFLALPSDEVSGGNTGFLYSRAKDVSPTSSTKVWQTSPIPPFADGVEREGKLLTVLSIDERDTIATLELPTDFPVEETFVGHSNTGKIFVLLLGATDEQALFETELTDLNAALTMPTPKTIPAGVALQRRKKTPFDRRAREDRAKKNIRTARQGLAPHRIELFSAQGQTTALGRWPWGWRDRLKSKALDNPTGDGVDGPLEVEVGRGTDMSVTVSWIDGEGALKLVAPVVFDTTMPGADSGLAQDDLVALSLVEGGNRMAIQKASLDPALCEQERECTRRISDFDDGTSIMVAPGIQGLQLHTALYGDIIIGNMPIDDFYDRVAPPTPITNATAAFENPTFVSPEGPLTNVIAAITTIDSGAYPSATHAVWAMDSDGAITGPGLVNFDTGADGPVIDQYSSINAAVLAKSDDGADTGTATVTVTATMTLTYATADSQLRTYSAPEQFVVSMRQDELLASIGKDDVTTIDLSTTPPLAVDASPINPLAMSSKPVMLPAPNDRLMVPFGPRPGETVVAELTEAQANSPILVSTTGDKCGSFLIQSVGTDAEGAITLTTLDEHIPSMEDCADQEILIGVGDFTGDGDGSQILTFNASARRISFRRAMKTALASTMRMGAEGFQIAPEIDLGDTRAALSARTGDFNGDGIGDVALNVGSTATQTNSTLIMLGDGNGGFLPEIIQAAQTPTIIGLTGPREAADACLAFYGEGGWTCEDEALKQESDGQYCGKTDHL